MWGPCACHPLHWEQLHLHPMGARAWMERQHMTTTQHAQSISRRSNATVQRRYKGQQARVGTTGPVNSDPGLTSAGAECGQNDGQARNILYKHAGNEPRVVGQDAEGLAGQKQALLIACTATAEGAVEGVSVRACECDCGIVMMRGGGHSIRKGNRSKPPLLHQATASNSKQRPPHLR